MLNNYYLTGAVVVDGKVIMLHLLMHLTVVLVVGMVLCHVLVMLAGINSAICVDVIVLRGEEHIERGIIMH
tara:strand:- start:358 stop:570 length:213 start_codon:yes stop_codon:yes gene_type:complete